MAKSKKKLLLPAVLFLGILVLGFGLSCSMEGQVYGRLTLALEVPQLPASKAGTGPVSSRFIHPAGATLSFKLYANNTLFNKQTIALDPDSPKPQTATLTIENVPYNKELRAEIRVYGETTPVQGDEELLGSNDIYIGYLKSGNNEFSFGIKPVTDTTVEYMKSQGDHISFYTLEGTNADTFNITMYPKKGLYTVYGYFDKIYLYDSEGKNYQNSFLINGDDDQNFRVFYHPEDSPSTYYAYLSEETSVLNGYKLDQGILITRGDYVPDEIVNSGGEIYFGQLSQEISSTTISFTIYNPYPFTLNPNYNREEDNPQSFTFNDFPDIILPGTSKEFTVIFETEKNEVNVPITISANKLENFVLNFTGSYC